MRPDAARVAFVRLGRAFPPALITLARVRLQRLSPIGNCRNPPAAAENAANFFRSSARAAVFGNCRNPPAAAENAANFFRSSARAAVFFGGLPQAGGDVWFFYPRREGMCGLN